MKRRELHLSRPVYEALPWAYMLCGLMLLVASYGYRGSRWSVVMGLVGLASLVGGIVVLLRRRDFRELRSQYGSSDPRFKD